MAVVTVGTVLDRSRRLEARLAAYCAAIRDRSADNGVRLVTYFLIRHRRRQEKALAGLAPDMVRQLRKVALRFEGPCDPTSGLRLPDVAPEAIKGDELIEAAVGYDRAWVSFYRSILAQPVDAGVRKILESLIRAEERDTALLRKLLTAHYF